MIRQPALSADIQTLADIYTGKMAVTAKDLQKLFGVSASTSYQVVRFIYAYAKENGRTIYSQPSQKIIPTDILFEAYGWDPRQIIERVKLLKKIS